MAYLYYNLAGIGDVLLIQLDPKETPTDWKKNGDFVSLWKGDKVIGYHLFNLSHYFSISSKGPVYNLEPSQMNQLNEVILKNGFSPLTGLSGGIVVGKIISSMKHPDSDHLHVCQVNIGKSTLQIVCGAANVTADQTVVVALPETRMPDGTFILPTALRGVQSQGMICSARELGLPEASQKGILILNDNNYALGEPFFK